MTSTQLIYQALRDLGVLRPGQSTSSDVLNDCLVEANQMIDSWLLDRFLVYAIVPNSYNLSAGVQKYTIGPAEIAPSFTATRPTRIENANIILNTVSPVTRVQVEVVTAARWSQIPVQALPFAIPQLLWYQYDLSQPGGAGTINLWPGPQVAYQLELFTWQQLQSFADLTTDYKFPPGYALMLRKNLAVAIEPMMKFSFKIPDPLLDTIAMQAIQAKAAVEQFNVPPSVKHIDPAFTGSGGGFNYATGEVGGR